MSREDYLRAYNAIRARYGYPAVTETPGPFTCPGCGFQFAGRTAGKTSCQYCGQPFPALEPAPAPAEVMTVTARPPARPDPGRCTAPHPPGLPWSCGCPRLTGFRDPVTMRTPEEEIRAVIAEPIGLHDEDLPAYGQPGPGACIVCLGPREAGSKRLLCMYCAAASRDGPGPEQQPAGIPSSRPVFQMAMIVLICAMMLWVSGILAATGVIP